MSEDSAAGGCTLRQTAPFLLKFVYATGIQLAAQNSLLPVAVGSAVVCTAFFTYICSSSPRWKGAPGLFGHANRNAPRRVKLGATQINVATGESTTTSTLWDIDSTDEGTRCAGGSGVVTATSSAVLLPRGTTPLCVEVSPSSSLFSSAHIPILYMHAPICRGGRRNGMVRHKRRKNASQGLMAHAVAQGMNLLSDVLWPRAVAIMSLVVDAVPRFVRCEIPNLNFLRNRWTFSFPSSQLLLLRSRLISSEADGMQTRCGTQQQPVAQADVKVMDETSDTHCELVVRVGDNSAAGITGALHADAVAQHLLRSSYSTNQCTTVPPLNPLSFSCGHPSVVKQTDDVEAKAGTAHPPSGPWIQGATVRHGEMRIGRFLGRGRWGKVFQCCNPETGEVLAVKQLIFDDNDPKVRQRVGELRLELDVLRLANRCRVPWIVGFRGVERRGSSVLLFMEYCARGSLLDYLTQHVAAARRLTSRCGAEIVSERGGSPLPHRRDDLYRQSSCVEKGAGGTSNHRPVEGSLREETDGGILPPLPQVSPYSPDCRQRANAERPWSNPLALPIREIQRFMRQTVEALHFLHSNGYAHLDVKTANVLVTADGDVRLADFGCCGRLRQGPTSLHTCVGHSHAVWPSGLLDGTPHAAAFSGSIAPSDPTRHNLSTPPVASMSESGDATAGAAGIHGSGSCNCVSGGDSVMYPTLVDDELTAEPRGTALYVAPEVIRLDKSRIGAPSDVWAAGCVAMELATGEVPWQHVAEEQLCVMFRVASTKEDLPLPPRIVEAVRDARWWLACYSNDAEANGRDVHDHHSAAKLLAHEEEEERRYDAATVRRCDRSENAANHFKCDIESLVNMQLLVSLEDFLHSCLHIRPEERPNCEEMLRHPFLVTR
ncbi:protein kinase, putative [Trypanosoma brucei gambiense DAL972]|uniref:Protein kinase, putative n=1 Tax=Trypanosoma brucei gambiense (strain MHOM/CI/86/DAL972) TaxID=679716 RepID=C9ZUM8_TRYB9|nr:protein kinase, putative [Trypanosoma brucei gambiense DAL972]CBH13116.1 protein kinase, putative [Trypanosoma brucei gambiense DAL972]|eukprot:XP_011775393.1 protein kinase, putative [Trypanosoma brucei gambiense DAL972]